MNKPKFVSGSYTVYPEHPSNWEVKPIGGYVKDVTLGGTHVKDVMYRKYQYVLVWDAMSKEDFDDMQELVNYHNDQGDDILFTYAKWPMTVDPVECHCDLLSRGFVAGSGATDYYQSVTITLTEKSSRI